jgi:hypothetical protein
MYVNKSILFLPINGCPFTKVCLKIMFSDSMILLGSVKRFELERMLWVHLSQDQKVVMPDDDIASTPGSSRAPTPPPRVEFIPAQPKSRFKVSKVDETLRGGKGVSPKPSVFSIARSVSNILLGTQWLSDYEFKKIALH